MDLETIDGSIYTDDLLNAGFTDDTFKCKFEGLYDQLSCSLVLGMRSSGDDDGKSKEIERKNNESCTGRMNGY